MFNDIPGRMLARMQELEERDSLDRNDGTPRQQRLRQIPPETGRFLAMLCALAPEGDVLEVGTSAGYSALWLSLACRERGDRLTTFEVLPEKAALARETFRIAGVEQFVELSNQDAREALETHENIGFCFLDAEKEIYAQVYELVVPRLAAGGLLVADNMISHAGELAGFIAHAERDPRVDVLVAPVGKGLLVCRKAADNLGV